MNTTRIAGMLRVLSLFLLIALTTHAQAATYSFKSLNVPGAEYIGAASINASGQVAGYYVDAAKATHGFVYSKGQYTTLNVPGAESTGATSINASGQVVGHYPFHGFMYSEGKYTSLNAGRNTSPASINDSGQVVGDYVGPSINPGIHGFMYSGGKYTDIIFPVPGPGFKNTGARSISASGQVVGYYEDASGDHGFVYSEGKYTSLDPPGATYSSASSINASGQVVGDYVDASGRHGFIATPMTLFSTFNVTRLVIDQNRGALFLGSNFTLGKDSNGINPVREEVTLKIANATLTIPAGSFHKNSHPSFFAFAGQIDNVWIEALIKPVGRNHFALQALAYGALLGDTKNPVMVELTIGDDNGMTTAQARTH